jgi:hypothetical protein
LGAVAAFPLSGFLRNAAASGSLNVVIVGLPEGHQRELKDLDSSPFENFTFVGELALDGCGARPKAVALKGVKAGQKVLLVATALNEMAHARPSQQFALLQSRLHLC